MGHRTASVTFGGAALVWAVLRSLVEVATSDTQSSTTYTWGYLHPHFPRTGKTGSSAARSLLPRITKLPDAQSILDVIEHQGDGMNGHHVILCFRCLGECSATFTAAMAKSPSMQKLLRLLSTAIETKGFDPERISKVLVASARIRPKCLEVESVIAKCMGLLQASMCIADAEDLADCVWACAKLASCADNLVLPVTRKLHTRMKALKLIHLQKLAWSFATIRLHCPGILNELADEIVLRHAHVTAQGLANVAWAFSTMVVKHTALEAAIVDGALCRMSTFKPQELSNLAWAGTRIGGTRQSFYDAIAYAARPYLKAFKPQELSNIVWAYSTSRSVGAEHIFDEIAQVVPLKVSAFKTQELANTVWAFATQSVDNELLVQSIAAESALKFQSFEPQHIYNLAWAFAVLRCREETMFQNISDAANAQLVYFQPQGLANLAWAYGELHFHDARLFGRISSEAVTRIGDFRCMELAAMVWAFKVVDAESGRLQIQVLTESAQRLDEFKSQELATLMWACGASVQWNAMPVTVILHELTKRSKIHLRQIWRSAFNQFTDE